MNIERLIMRATIVVSLLLIAGIAQAQTRVTPCSPTTPNNALCVSWGAVATDTVGAPITGVTYRVEHGTSATGTFTTAQASTSGTSYYATSLSTGTHYYRVYASCVACTNESAASNTASGSATPIPVIPSAPVIIIAATIRAGQPPVYRIIQSVTLRQNEVVFTAPASMRTLFVN